MPTPVNLMRHLSAAELGELIGVTPRRVRQMLTEDNPPPQDPETKQFPLAPAGLWIRSRILSEAGTSSDGQSYDLEAERARLAHHQANLAALEEETKRKTLLPSDLVQSRWQSIVANMRAKLLNLPGRGAVAVTGLASVQETEKELRKLVYEALRELSNDLAKPDSNS